MSLGGQIRKLEEQGIDLVGILGGDLKISPHEMGEILRKLPRGLEDTLYSELIQQLTLQRLPEEEARRIWNLVTRHKQWLNRALGRNVGFRVAFLDYLSNKQPLLRGARLIGNDAFEMLVSQVSTDDLTKVYNRRYLMDQLAREIDRARRYGSKLSLLLVDVDNFKLYNDTRGHVAGDEALREVAAALARSARTTDLVCRYGGDEFAILCPRTVKHDALTLADRLRKAVRDADLKPDLRTGARALTLSVGVATYPDDAEESVALIQRADEALYRAKEEANKLSDLGSG
jgi:diguanylate cyclase (GGDEF)-like protein